MEPEALVHHVLAVGAWAGHCTSQSFSICLSKKEAVPADPPSSWGRLKVFRKAVCILHRPDGIRHI